jgi:hypothetical protein
VGTAITRGDQLESEEIERLQHDFGVPDAVPLSASRFNKNISVHQRRYRPLNIVSTLTSNPADNGTVV